MKKLLLSLALISSVSYFVSLSTNAYFSDTETAEENIFEAGSIDLKIHNQSYVWKNDQWEYNQLNSWALQDMLPQFRYFSFEDVKPGDLSQDTIALEIESNPAWVCADVKLTASAENGVIDPELDAGDTSDNGNWEGELDEELNFVFWADDGDFTLENSEEVLFFGSTADLLQGDNNEGFRLPVIDSQNNPWGNVGEAMQPGSEGRISIGKAWCAGNLTLVPQPEGNGISQQRQPSVLCNGDSVGNISQTDSLIGDIGFYAEQARNNSSFQCSDLSSQIEVLQISSLSSDVVQSETVLETGKTYLIESTGTYTFAFGERKADAEYWYNPDTTSWYEEIGVPPTEYNLDLMVNNSTQDWLGSSDGINYYPHTFSPDHKYRLYILGENQPLFFYIYDSSYDGNEGGLTVSIKPL